MSKEMWVRAFEGTIENIMEDNDVEYDEAREILVKKIDAEGDSFVSDYWYR